MTTDNFHLCPPPEYEPELKLVFPPQEEPLPLFELGALFEQVTVITVIMKKTIVLKKTFILHPHH
jgi:hypothetical protein